MGTPAQYGDLSPKFLLSASVPLCALLIVLSLAGCATAPPPPPPVQPATWLGSAHRVVVRLDASKVDAWRELTKTPDLKAVGERTKVVWLGLDLDSLDDLKGAAANVRMVLEGDFPKGAAGLMLDWNKAWKKAPGDVWTNAKLDLSVSLPRDNVVTVRRHDASVPQSDPDALRGLDPAVLARSAVWITFWDPGRLLFGTVGAKLLPLDRVDAVLQANGAVLEGPLLLYFSDERAARAAAVVLRLTSGAVRARLGQDLAWTVEGSTITGSTLRIKQDDLKALAATIVPQQAAP